ncbi:MAG: hypothetical protein J6Y36_08725 [Treponema sp.]|uniref:hypothetical protein n=1 Tax=Treponema sp. TaxID=166 RepID=UPI001B55D771|nr:hypothetical protein [Treponema sp.]MBP5403226.1 hypothetical protein [Treponema sp.]MBR5932752.1 hypothetical protein [Treponema sp.]
MADSQFIIWCIKLILGGIASFFAILLWSKSRNAGWMCLTAGILIYYAGVIYSMMLNFGIIATEYLIIAGIPLLTLFFTAVPPLFIIAALILIIKDLS